MVMPLERSQNKSRKNNLPAATNCRWVGLAILVMFLVSLGSEFVYSANKSGLPLPRFVSLRKEQVNVRTGPGKRYPIEWVFTYKNMPVKIVEQFKGWRKVQDWQGTNGWVHQSMLTGKHRWIIVHKDAQQLRQNASPGAEVIAKLEKKVIGRLNKCRRDWCEVKVKQFQGWIPRTSIWGVLSNELTK